MVYFLVVVIISLFALLIKNKNRFLLLAFLILGFLIAFKDVSVGTDTLNYASGFERDGILSFQEMFNSDIEVGYFLLVKLLHVFTDNYQIIFIFEGLLITIAYYIFFRDNTDTVIEAYYCVIAYLSFNLFSFQLTGLRQSIAMAICILSYKYIKERKLFPFCLIVFFGSLFHTSALFFIPSYIFYSLNLKNTKTFFCTAIGSIAILINTERIITRAYGISDRYASYGIESTGNGYIFWLIMLGILLIAFYSIENLSFSVENELENNELISFEKSVVMNGLLSIHYLSFIIWSMRLVSRTAERPSYYFLPMSIVLLSRLRNAFTEETQKLFDIIMIMLLIFLFIHRTKNITYTLCW